MSPFDSEPLQPAVIPRAGYPGNDARIPIDQLVRPLLDASHGLICVTAPPGGGKTCALTHLRYAFSDAASVQFFDADLVDAALQFAASSLAVLACQTIDPDWRPLAMFELKPWTLDDCIEYLARKHRERLPDVMAQVAKDPMLPSLQGSPELLALVMDELAGAPVILSIDWHLRRRVRALQLPQDVFLAMLDERRRIETSKTPAVSWTCVEIGDLPGWFRHEGPQRLKVSEDVADGLSPEDCPSCMENMRGRAFIEEIAGAVARNPDARRSLEARITRDPSGSVAPMAVSILLKVDPRWRPPSRRRLNLRGAILRNARWKGIDLVKANLIEADCTGADFADANLSKVQASDAIMNRARLSGAILFRGDLTRCKLQNAILTAVSAERINLDNADLTGAKLTNAKLSSAFLNSAILIDANLSDAILDSAVMERAEVHGADFTNGDFSDAQLKHVDMSEATWNGARFRKASIRICNLEGLEINRADFRRADLTRSLLTASRMIGGNFEGACLASTGLAEIDWEDANLSYANLSHASFHLGSSRSGLVGSNIPCEGSRTGFYTDDYNEQTCKSPEEIRKACLCGADLTGAVLNYTDFYLVDLRRARYSTLQRLHFDRCGAILESRVPD